MYFSWQLGIVNKPDKNNNYHIPVWFVRFVTVITLTAIPWAWHISNQITIIKKDQEHYTNVIELRLKTLEAKIP